MNIKIKDNTRNITLRFPSFLVFNPVTATFAGSKIIHKISGEKADIKISPKAARRLFREINRFRRENKNWKILEVRSVHGSVVSVKL